MSSETAESIFMGAVARAILQFVSDDSLKTVDNFICYLDIEGECAEKNQIRCGCTGTAQQLNEFRKDLKLRLKIGDILGNSDTCDGEVVVAD